MSVAKMRAFPAPIIPAGLRRRRLIWPDEKTETEDERVCKVRTEAESARKRTVETVTIVVYDAPAASSKVPRMEHSHGFLRSNDELRMLYEELVREEPE
jgi:hypothetical protein